VPQTTKTDQPSISDIVALLAADSAEGAPKDLRAHSTHAGEVIDGKRAAQFADVLIEFLATAPDAVEELEALVVLWLAHPKALSGQATSMSTEARRLATLYERGGEVERAQSLLEMLAARDPDDKAIDHDLASLMQRTGNADRLVERYLRRSEEAMREGRRRDAVTWLREVLSIDRSRRDVARMIRDLQYEESDKRRAWRRRVRVSSLLIVLLAVVLGAVWRESWMQQQYASIPAPVEDDLPGMQARLAAVDELIASSPLWLGAFQASRDRADLRVQIAKLESRQLQAEMAAEAELRRRLDEAESNHVRGRMAIEQGDFRAGIGFYRSALSVAPADWEHRSRLEADVVAVESWLSANPNSKGKRQ
jgi:tetratricopeptide (TPR) repeat protein